MADGAVSCACRVPEGSECQARPAPGPLPHHAEWKGMGPCCCYCPTSCHPAAKTTATIPPSLRLLLVIIFLLNSIAWATVSGFSLQPNSQCQIDQCWDQYTKAKDALEIAGGVSGGGGSGNGNSRDIISSSSGQQSRRGAASSGDLDNEAHCVALRTYWNCIKGTKNSSRGCQGNIRYYSVRNGVKNQMKQYNCTMTGRTMEPPSPGVQPQPPARQVPAHCQFSGTAFRHCGLFGDPHLRTFHDQFQTCKVKGAWPLINNDYLTVQVTNNPVQGGAGEATATSKLTVIVKSQADCGSPHYHTYQAQTDSLPGAFEDGNTSYGPYGSVYVREVENNRHIEIHVTYIATTIIVRQIGRYFTFAVHMPEELVNSSRQHHEPELCTKGCPASEQINYKQYLAHKHERIVQLQNRDSVIVTRSEAEDVCRKAGLVDFYFDSCVFDLMATGDKNFTLAALSALKDVLRLDPDKAVQSSRSTLEVYDDLYGASAAAAVTVSWWWYVVCVMSLWLTLCQSPVIQQPR